MVLAVPDGLEPIVVYVLVAALLATARVGDGSRKGRAQPQRVRQLQKGLVVR